jgi:hypothetical protein
MKTVKRAIVAAGVLGSLVIVRWLLETALFFSEAAAKLNPTAGTVVFWLLILVYVLAITSFAVSWFALPARLLPPDETDSATTSAYYSAVWKRLRQNRLLLQRAAIPASVSLDHLQTAQRLLDDEARIIIQDCAKRVFVATAVAPTGRVDFLIVLAEEARLVWRLAKLYGQRVGSRDFAAYLINVAVDSFAAMRLSDVNIAPTIHNLMAHVYVPHAAHISHGVPFVGPVVAKMIDPLINSVTDGSLNALFILKTGFIAQRYCQFEPISDRNLLRNESYQTAIRLLPNTIGGQMSEIASAVAKSPWDYLKGKFSSKSRKEAEA